MLPLSRYCFVLKILCLVQCTIIQNMCCWFIKKNLYILITFPLHKSPYKMTKKSLKTKLFSISGWNERLSNHRSCIKRMRGKLAKDCIKCLKHRVGPVTLSAADSTVFFFFATTQIYIKCESPGKKYSEITIQATHKVIIVKIFIFFRESISRKISWKWSINVFFR